MTNPIVTTTYSDGTTATGPRPLPVRSPQEQKLDDMVNRFLQWQLPKDFYPDGGISFDGRKDDEFNKNKTWPIGTNLFTADQARAMLVFLMQDSK